MKKNNIYKPCVWNVTQLDKNIITQNDNRKIPKIKIITNPTTHPFTLQPFPNKKKKKKKKKKHQFHMLYNKVEIIAENDKS
jgi:hypothetical protein